MSQIDQRDILDELNKAITQYLTTSEIRLRTNANSEKEVREIVDKSDKLIFYEDEDKVEYKEKR